MTDMIRKEDALYAAYEADSLELQLHGASKIMERIAALPAVAFDELVPFLKTANEASREQLIVLSTNILAALTPTAVDASQPADPDVNAAAIREAVLREAAAECDRHADWIEETKRQGVYSAEGCLRTSARNIRAMISTNGAAAPDLTDPVTVHANMLRGTIAKPTVEQIIHLYGVDALAKALAPVIVREAGIEPVAAPDHAPIREGDYFEGIEEGIKIGREAALREAADLADTTFDSRGGYTVRIIHNAILALIQKGAAE